LRVLRVRLDYLLDLFVLIAAGRAPQKDFNAAVPMHGGELSAGLWNAGMPVPCFDPENVSACRHASRNANIFRRFNLVRPVP